MSCICGVLQGAATAGYRQVRADEDDSTTSGGASLGISSDEDGDSSSSDLLQARISALEEMWDSARSEVEALRTELDESQAARAELEARAAATARPHMLPLSETELKQLALERLARQRGLSMDELRTFKGAATPAELELLRADLRECVADVQKQAEPTRGDHTEVDAAALEAELVKVKETLQVERARRESAERSAATTKEMLQNASSRMKVITAEKQTIARQLEQASAVVQQKRSPVDTMELNSGDAVAAAEHLSNVQLRFSQAEREYRAQRQSLQDRCAKQSVQLQQLSDQLSATSSNIEAQRVQWKQETDRLRASLVAAEHGHSVALVELRKEADENWVAALDVEVAAAEQRGKAQAAVERTQLLERERQTVAEHAGRAEAAEAKAERLRTEMRAAEEALASAELKAEQQAKLAKNTNIELMESRNAAAAVLKEALDGRRAAEERAITAQESVAVRGAEAEKMSTALASAMEDAQRYRSRLLASNLANERRWAAALIQRYFYRRRQARAVLSLCMAAAARAREEEAAYRFAIDAAKQHHEDAMAAAETRRNADLERAKEEAAKLFGELAVAPALSAPHRSSPNAQLKLGTFTDMSVGGARRANLK